MYPWVGQTSMEGSDYVAQPNIKQLAKKFQGEQHASAGFNLHIPSRWMGMPCVLMVNI